MSRERERERERELERLISIIHKTVVDVAEGEKCFISSSC